MRSALQAITLFVLAVWPLYNIGMALLALRPTAGPSAPAARTRHQYWLLIPALNEGRVLARSVATALALDTPDTPVRVMVIDDGSDDDTAEVLAGIASERLTVLRRDYPVARQGKGEALNAGYRAVRAIAAAEGTFDTTIVAVFDADGRADPRLLSDINPLFADPGTGAVQARVRIHNRTRVLGLLQDIEFSSIANASQSLRDRLGTVGMGGNGQFVRLGVLARLGESPWTSCLVEDMDLSLRLHLAGVGIRYTSQAAISQQAVVELRPLLRQRARWAQGNLQCFRYVPKLLRSREIGSVALLDYLWYLMAPWFTVPMTLVVLAAATMIVLGQFTGNEFGGLVAIGNGAEVAIALWVAVFLLPGTMWGLWYWRMIGEEPLWRCLLAGLGYPGFLVLGIVSTWRAVWRHASGRRGWAKTERVDDTGPAVASTYAGRHRLLPGRKLAEDLPSHSQ